jgi:four helix bundle protein
MTRSRWPCPPMPREHRTRIAAAQTTSHFPVQRFAVPGSVGRRFTFRRPDGEFSSRPQEVVLDSKESATTPSIYKGYKGQTASFPRDERYRLTTQLRQSSSSIAANLAEGSGRNIDAGLARFCSIAMGSASELDSHLLLASDLNLINAADYTVVARQTTDVKRMLTGHSTLTSDR